MWEVCTERIREFGGSVLLNHRVTAIEMDDGRITAVVVDTPEGSTRIAGDHFFSTMPVRSLVRALSPSAPQPVMQAANGLRYRDFLVVALMLDKDDLFPDNWIYIHTPGVKVGRVQNFNNWSQDMVPEPGRTCLGLEYFCFEGDGLWTARDEDLVALATEELQSLELAGDAKVVDGTVIRMPKAYPIYDGEYRGHLDVVRGFVDLVDNLHLVGRNGLHKYNNQDHSMLTAMMAVENMQGGTHDLWEVNTDYEYHEEQRLDAPAEEPVSVAS